MTDRGRLPHPDDPEAHASLGGIEEDVIGARGGEVGQTGAFRCSRRTRNG